MKAKLTINIFDETNQALNDVSLILSYDKQSQKQYSNTNGQCVFQFDIDLNDKPYATCDLTLQKQGYQQLQIIALQIFEAAPSSLTIILTKEEDEVSIIDEHKLVKDDAYVE